MSRFSAFVLVSLALFPLGSTELVAQLAVPSFFSDHMVIQRNRDVAIWGKALPYNKVEIDFKGRTYSTTADENGLWRAKFDSGTADPRGHEIVIRSFKNTIVIKDVLIGEVWLASGQSNMAFTMDKVPEYLELLPNLKPDAGEEASDEEVDKDKDDAKTSDTAKTKDAAKDTPSESAEKEPDESTVEAESVPLVALVDLPRIRMFSAAQQTARRPALDIGGSWHLPTRDSAAELSAVAYWFAHRLNDDLDVPIGIIKTAWGGKPIETFTSVQALKARPQTKPLVDKMMEDQKKYTPEGAKAIYEQRVAKYKEAYANWEKELKEAKAKLAEAEKNAASKTASVEETATNDAAAEQESVEEKGGKDDAVAQESTDVKPEVADEKEPAGESTPAEGEAASQKVAEKITLPKKPKPPVFPKPPLLREGNPGVLFNGMIFPFAGYAIRGAIWYQGEANAKPGKAPYDVTLPLMILDWRYRWKEQFPFFYVQLANYKTPSEKPGNNDPWPLLQDRQRRVLKLSPKTGMAIINDVGDADDIHPKDKKTVGNRLALLALAQTYGHEIVKSGPLFQSSKTSGSAINIVFGEVGNGLRTRDDGPLQRFEIAGEDKIWHWAKAEITDGNTVKVSSDQVPKPVAVRYAWAANPAGANLVNSEGLPASVFRTDDWNDVIAPVVQLQERSSTNEPEKESEATSKDADSTSEKKVLQTTG